jgi:hypothetical protein
MSTLAIVAILAGVAIVLYLVLKPSPAALPLSEGATSTEGGTTGLSVSKDGSRYSFTFGL